MAISSAHAWLISASAASGESTAGPNTECLNGLARQRLNTKLIAQNWDDFLRVAGSLKMGTISGSELIRSLQRGSKKSLLARAIGELGRIPKTLHLLAYIDDESFRRRILTQLNRGEGRHSLARKCFFGQRGELRQRYREGQEDQLGALGLVVNALILWNTRYMDAALDHLKRQGFRTQAGGLGALVTTPEPTLQRAWTVSLHRHGRGPQRRVATIE